MRTQVAVVHRFVAPFLAGVSMAGAAVTSDVFLVGMLLAAGVWLAFLSLPAGGRMLERLSDTAS